MAADETHRLLSDLVRARMAELGLSYRRLAELCEPPADQPSDAGALWTRGTLENLVKGRRIRPPDLPRLQALAAALEIPLRTVQEAAGKQFFGIDTLWSADGKVRALVADFEAMDDEDQARVLALMQARRRVKE